MNNKGFNPAIDKISQVSTATFPIPRFGMFIAAYFIYFRGKGASDGPDTMLPPPLTESNW